MDQAAHSEEPQSGPSGRSHPPWLVYIPVLLLIYLLGAGPAAWLVENVPASDRVISVLYAPLDYLGQNCEPFGDALDWYLRTIWGVDTN